MAEATKTNGETRSEYQSAFIGAAKGANALKFDGDYGLKSKRSSPYFFNMGEFNSGSATSSLSAAYADTIADKLKGKFDVIYGIPEKGVSLAAPISLQLAEKHSIDSNWFFTRKMPKEYGEITGQSREDMAKTMIVGKVPPSGSRIVLIDDVLTTGDTKYQSVDLLNKILDKPNIVALVISVDRQEVGLSGKSAVEEFTEKTGIPVYSILKATEISDHLKDESQDQSRRISNYLRVYGTSEAREAVKNSSEGQNIIKIERSVIPACDMYDIEAYERLVKETHDLDGIGGYKIGFELGLTFGLPYVAEVTRKYTDKPLIYDHQKAGSDIPDTGKNFAQVIKKAGFDAMILFPQAGPETQRAWTYRALDSGLGIMVGGIMTHNAYLQSEGGYITDDGALEMYRLAAMAGVRHVVVPGTKPDIIKMVKEMLEKEGVSPVFYSPGLGTGQGGKMEEVTSVLGSNWHAIVGRQIVNATDYRKAAEESIATLIRA